MPLRLSGNTVRVIICLCLCTMVTCKGGKGGKGAAVNSRPQENNVHNSGAKYSHMAGNWMIYGPVLGCIFLIALCVLYDKINNYMRYRHSQAHSMDYTRVIEASCHTLDQVKVVHDPVTGLYVPIDPLECTVHDVGEKRRDGAPSPDYIEVNSVQIGALEQRPTLYQDVPMVEQERVGSEQQIPVIVEQQKVGVRQQRPIMEQRNTNLNEYSPSAESDPRGASARRQRSEDACSTSPGQVRKRSEKTNSAEKQRGKMVEFDGFQRTTTRSDGKSARRPTFAV